MPSKKKNLIRARMKKTGERYTTALAHVRAAARTPSAPSERAPRGRAADPGGARAQFLSVRYFGTTVRVALVETLARTVAMFVSAGEAAAVDAARRPSPRPLWRVLGQRGVH